MLMPKRSKHSKSKNHQLALERHVWHKGEFEELYFENETIQASLKTKKKPSSIA